MKQGGRRMLGTGSGHCQRQGRAATSRPTPTPDALLCFEDLLGPQRVMTPPGAEAPGCSPSAKPSQDHGRGPKQAANSTDPHCVICSIRAAAGPIHRDQGQKLWFEGTAQFPCVTGKRGGNKAPGEARQQEQASWPPAQDPFAKQTHSYQRRH